VWADEAWLEPVEVDAPTEPAEPAANTSTIELDQAASFGRSLSELLSRVPGLYVKRAGSVLQPARAQLRGAAAEQVVVTLDGVPLNSLANAAFDLSLIPIYALQDAIISRGAGSLVVGSGSQGGVIALRSAAQGEQPDSVSATLGGGSFGHWHGNLAGTLSTDSAAIRAGVGLSAVEGDFDFVDLHGDAQTRQNNDAFQVGAFASGQLTLAEAVALSSTTLFSWTERGAPGPSEFPQRFSLARSEETQFLSVLKSGAKEAIGLFDEAYLDPQLSLAYRYAGSVYDNPKALLGGASYHSEAQEHSLRPHFELSLLYGSAETKLLLASRHEWLERTLESQPSDGFERHGFAVAATQELSPFANDALILQAGLRMELDDDGEIAWIPRAELLLSPWPTASLQLDLGTSFRRPAFDELYLRSEFIRGNPELENEEAFRTSARLMLRPHPALRGDLGLFLIDFENLIQFVPNNALFYQATNLRGALSRGVELELWTQPFEALSATLAYTYTLAERSAPPHYPLPGRPKHLMSALIGFEYDPLHLELEARYVSERSLDVFGKRMAASAVFLDASASVALFSAWSVSVSASNILDVRDAIDALQYPLPSRAFFASLAFKMADSADSSVSEFEAIEE
jgi:outer membrane cobalamin receptor